MKIPPLPVRMTCSRQDINVKVIISKDGLQTIADGRKGPLRPWRSMVRAGSSSPDWTPQDEYALLQAAGWRIV